MNNIEKAKILLAGNICKFCVYEYKNKAIQLGFIDRAIECEYATYINTKGDSMDATNGAKLLLSGKSCESCSWFEFFIDGDTNGFN